MIKQTNVQRTCVMRGQRVHLIYVQVQFLYVCVRERNKRERERKSKKGRDGEIVKVQSVRYGERDGEIVRQRERAKERERERESLTVRNKARDTSMWIVKQINIHLTCVEIGQRVHNIYA